MKRILDWFIKHATVKNLILAFMAVIPFNLFLFPFLTGKIEKYSGGVSTLDVTLGYLPSTAQQFIAAYTPEGRSIYILTEWTADLFYPLAYTFLFSILLALIYKEAFPADSPFHNLRWAPLAMMVFDYLENISITFLLAAYPQSLSPLAVIASFASLLKWVLGFTTLIALLVGGVAIVIAKRPSRN